MARVFSTLLVLGLLGGTAAAFAVTEGLKLEKSPITATKVDKVFSPVCACPSERAGIGFRLRKADRLTVTIVDADDNVVRTLIRDELRGRGFQRFFWNGRSDSGVPVADGSYKPRVRFAGAHRTIVLPNPIEVDTAPPAARLLRVTPRVFGPGIPLHGLVRVRYRFNEPSRALLYVNGDQRMKKKQFERTGTMLWNGRIDGLPAPAGLYRVELRAQDRAGNTSALTRPAVVRIRYVELAPTRLVVREQTRFGVRILTPAGQYSWRLGKRKGVARDRVLVLRAGYQGRYRLIVTVGGHAAQAIVLVERRP